MKTTKCTCETCELIRGFEEHVFPKITKEGRDLIGKMYERMELAETDFAWNEGKGKDGERIRIGGRWYIPQQPIKKRKGKKFKMVKVREFDASMSNIMEIKKQYKEKT